MANSMTGFGRAQEIRHGRELTVEIKSVNSRYFEYNSRVPRSLGFVDDAVKKAVSAVVQRGKVELYLGLQNIEAAEIDISANIPVVEGYYEALTSITSHFRMDDRASLEILARMPDVFNLKRNEADEDELRDDVLAVAEIALERFQQMRTAEGAKLVQDVLARLDTLDALVQKVEKDSAGRVARYTERLAERLREVLADRSIEDGRILTEAAIFADKTAVDEESVRLHSHLEQYREILAAGGPMGRKLDFLTQELNRETNTIGSKCQELEITRLVVEMKSEIEKIREQIQNME